MRLHLFTPTLATLLAVVLIVPSALLAAPQRTYAQGVPITEGITGIKTSVESTISAIKDSLALPLKITSTAAELAQEINAYVLQPLAFVLSGNLMKQLTASVIGFVIGKANSTGVPQFVVDVNKSMRTVADGPALAYLNNMSRTHSPFSYSISNALKSDYLKKTSLEGFWAANMNTLDRSSPNVTAYLAGNWSQGGVTAWFSLTTQVQNNPYTLYQSAQSQMGTLIGPGVGGATGSRKTQLDWGKGMLSWCGDLGDAAAADMATADANFTSYTTATTCLDAGGDWSTASNSCVSPISNAVGVSSGDPCTKKDGTPGSIKTPGSVISATLDKVLGGQQDQILRMGNVGPQINQILANIGTVMQTIDFASQVLGGSSQDGLLAVNSSSGSSSSRLAMFAPTRDPSGNFTSGYLGATQDNANATGVTINAAAAANVAAGAIEAEAAAAAGAVDDLAGRIAKYESAWNTISAAANTASSSVTSLITTCTAVSNATQIAAAKTALTTEVAPVFAQAAAASTMIAASKVQLNTTATTSPTDTQSIQSPIPPTIADVISAQQNAQAYGAATANPTGSLVVASSSNSSIVDQMNLISKNAEALKTTACTARSFFGFGG